MMAALELLDKIDSIKCHAEVTIDTQTGKINKVVNFEESQETLGGIPCGDVLYYQFYNGARL